MKTMLERLLGHLHRAVFDTSADEIAAFYLDGPAGSKWDARDENFVITFADGREIKLDLNKHAIYQLITILEVAGMTVTRVNQDARLFSGITMLELSGEAGEPQPIMLYQDILHSIFGAYSREMRIAAENVNAAIKQMEIPSADDGFLDVWGNLFGVSRETMEDEEYRKAIPREAFRLRVNARAIEQTVLEKTGYEITLEEPYRDIFRLDISALSGVNRLYKEADVGYFIVQPTSTTNVNWDVVTPIIKQNLAAGITMLKPVPRYSYIVNDPLNGYIWWQIISNWSIFCHTSEMPRLDEGLRLSRDYSIPLNWLVTITSTQMVSESSTPVYGLTRYSPSRGMAWQVDGRIPAPRFEGRGELPPRFLQLYPSDPRTWMIGKWDPDATWTKPYEWKVWTTSSRFEQWFFADASHIAGTIHSQITSGETWEGPNEWDDGDWMQGNDAFWIEWFDATHKFEPDETAENAWEMTVDNAVNKLFNVGCWFRERRYSKTSLPGVTAVTLSKTGPSGVGLDVINDHTWRINNPNKAAGDVVIKIEGHTADGIAVDSQLTIHLTN